eukprot:6337004-Prymnesium_polylepis.2
MSSSFTVERSSSVQLDARAAAPEHWTLRARTPMAQVVGGHVSDDTVAAPRRFTRFQHFAADRDPITAHLGGGLQRVCLTPREAEARPPAMASGLESSIFEHDPPSVVE